MMDLKNLRSALEQLEEERGIPQDKILGAIEDALVAAYKKDYGKKTQIVRAKFDLNTGKTDFYQVKIAVDDSMLAEEATGITGKVKPSTEGLTLPLPAEGEALKLKFNEDQHLLLADARKIKKDVQPGEELVFPLETKDDYGRIAAQTAKQVIIQRLREAEKLSVLAEYADKVGAILNGKVQKIERGNVFVDLGRTTGLLPYEEQIPGEHYHQGERVRAYLAAVEETPRGVNLRLSRAHPKFIEKLFELETPEIANKLVEIKTIAREAGSRAKIAVASAHPNIDPVGACVGQRGIRVNTVINELGGEKIDIIKWAEDPNEFIINALAPAKINQLILNEENREAAALVAPDQFSLAVGKKGQNVRLAAKLTGWRIDIKSPEGETTDGAAEFKVEPSTEGSTLIQ
ncbi:MAG: transcription termination/antitermination protein NusA [Candidatus Vogelbacteria bacterium]|nr:transcription termination/antitermination protein NusA [Candidatus Vogelbacteria bacterium]